ncbi:hypothetical protein M0813_25013 [Anaeramoeba flamelloides]|uniref:Tc1-like transposase DDE domain-containing protein n=1 Tax=Anaeramoeba flamelloides TaxID=1746091 RepID=A0ABQ8Y471_9EUKA|nr:hypothetical protein M0813_25013 [Anaeramoeba flamelloides]
MSMRANDLKLGSEKITPSSKINENKEKAIEEEVIEAEVNTEEEVEEEVIEEEDNFEFLDNSKFTRFAWMKQSDSFKNHEVPQYGYSQYIDNRRKQIIILKNGPEVPSNELPPPNHNDWNVFGNLCALSDEFEYDQNYSEWCESSNDQEKNTENTSLMGIENGHYSNENSQEENIQMNIENMSSDNKNTKRKSQRLMSRQIEYQLISEDSESSDYNWEPNYNNSERKRSFLNGNTEPKKRKRKNTIGGSLKSSKILKSFSSRFNSRRSRKSKEMINYFIELKKRDDKYIERKGINKKPYQPQKKSQSQQNQTNNTGPFLSKNIKKKIIKYHQRMASNNIINQSELSLPQEINSTRPKIIIKKKIKRNISSLANNLSPKGKEFFSKKFSEILQNEGIKKLREMSKILNISYKTSKKWALNKKMMSKKLIENRLKRSKLNHEMIKKIQPLLSYRSNKYIINFVKNQYDILISNSLISRLRNSLQIGKRKKNRNYINTTTLSKFDKQEISNLLNENNLDTISEIFRINPFVLKQWNLKNMTIMEQEKRIKKRGRVGIFNKDKCDELSRFIDQQNGMGNIVTGRIIQEKVYSMLNEQWKPSLSWVSKTLHRLGFSKHKAICKHPNRYKKDYPDKIKIFKQKVEEYCQSQRNNKNFRLWCMDETGVWKYNNVFHTYTRKKNTNPYVKSMEGLNVKDTFVCCVNHIGEKMPLIGIKSQNQKQKQERQNDGSIVKKIVLPKVAGINLMLINRWVDCFLTVAKAGDLLIWDNHSTHKNKKIINRLEDAGIKIERIPPLFRL